MDNPPASRPACWLPWLVAAICLLAALYLAQLHAINRTENALLRDQLALADAANQSLRNQLEAERLLARHPSAEGVPTAPVNRN